MPFNGSGTFAVIYTFVPNTTISSTQMNSQFTDIASGLTNCLTKDGQSIMTGQIKAQNGTALAPAYSFGTDLNAGWYRIAADNIGLSLNGAKVVDYSASGVAVTGTFSASGASTLAGGALSGTFSGAPTFSGDVIYSGTPVFQTGASLTGTLSGNPTFSGVPVFSGNVSFTGSPAFTTGTPSFGNGASLGTGTFSGAATFSGALTFSGACTFSNTAGIAARNTIKASATVTESGGSYSLTAGFNVSGVSKNGTGDVTVTFTNALANATYRAIATIVDASGAGQATIRAKATGSVRVSCFNGSGSGAERSFDVVVTGE